MKKILWLASWYPSKVDPYTGDYIERHARAATLDSQISVLHVVRDISPVTRKKNSVEHRRIPGGGQATIMYYYSPGYFIPWLNKLHSNFVYLKLHKNYLKNYIRKNGKPDGIHVHIGLKAGMAALFLKYWYGIPYVVSEHWSGLCPEARPNFDKKPFLFRLLWKRVMKNALGYTAVSEYLATAIKNKFSLKKGHVIPNVVDTDIFYPAENRIKNARFIHISTLNYQKNAEQILEAAAILRKKLPEFSLLIFGNPNESLIKLTENLNLGNAIEFKGICPQEVLRENIQKSEALILYSRFESFGCVIIEANACGKPVIVSDIPVFHENVKQGITGLFVPLNNPELLADSMFAIATDKYSFDQNVIQEWASDHYSLEKIGKQFARFYELNFK
jgi:glycosyltransferase involved in cell wall biosynthesis